MCLRGEVNFVLLFRYKVTTTHGLPGNGVVVKKILVNVRLSLSADKGKVLTHFLKIAASNRRVNKKLNETIN